MQILPSKNLSAAMYFLWICLKISTFSASHQELCTIVGLFFSVVSVTVHFIVLAVRFIPLSLNSHVFIVTVGYR